jgi:RHS repeat-associated protein
VQFTQGEVNESAALSLGVPLGSYKGRGLNLPISLSYSSSLWRIEQLGKISNGTNLQSVTQAIYAEHSAAGWKSTLDLPKIEFPKQSDSYDYRGKPYPSPTWNGCFGYRIARVYIHMPDGSTHELRQSDLAYYSNTISTTGTFYAVDGSRMRYDSTSADTGTLYLPDGTRYVLGHPTSYLIDRNGNTQTFDETTRQWTDTVGRVILNPLPATPLDQPEDFDYQLPGLNGGSVTYTFKWRHLSDSLTPDAEGATPSLRYMASHFLPDPTRPPTSTWLDNAPQAQSSKFESLFQTAAPADPFDDPNFTPIPVFVVGKGQYGGNLFDPIVLQEIVLPDGTSYVFSYNTYGEITKVIYPTTAYEQYEYASSLADIDQDKQPYIQAQRRVTSRQLSVNGLGTDILEWKYSEGVAAGSAGNPVDNNRYRVISIIAPDKTRTEIYKYDPRPDDGHGKPYWNFDLANALEGLVFQKKVYSSSPDGLGGQLLRREITQYEQKANGYQFSVTCGQTPFTRSILAYRNPRPIKRVNIIFEGSGAALAQTNTFAYDATDVMTTGVDQILETTSQYAVIANSTAQSGTLLEIGDGPLARYSETTYLNSPGAPDRSTYRALNILGLATVTTVKDSAGTIVSQSEMRYDEGGYSPGIGRALPTSSRVWDSTKGAAADPNAYLTTHAKFDVYGNRIEATDAMGNTTITEYDPTYQAFPIKTRTPIPDPNPAQNPDGQAHGSQTAFETTTTFDYPTGLVLSTTDINGQTTQMEYNDPLLRPTRVIPPVGGGPVITEYGLGTTEATRFVKVKTQTDATNWKEATRFYDGAGRTIKTQLKNSNGDVFAETEYDNMGRVQRTTNPYRANESKSWIATTYDDLGRVTRVTSPDGAQFQTAYGLSTMDVIGTTKTNTDQAGKKRSGITDALGRMIRVIEDPDHQNLVTDYVFDTLGHLRKTTQGEQVRYFMYDSVGRVLYSRQPEQEVNASFNATDPITGNTQWSAKFTYDDNSNNVSTTDAQDISVSVTYDRLNRLIARDYSDTTPDVSFFHDGTGLGQVPNYSKGQVTKVSSSVTESRYTAFDNLGRIKSSQQITNGVTYNFADYTYDLGGNLISETYPSGRVVKTTLDASGDLAKVESKKDASSPWATYLDMIKYNAAGAVTESRLGNGLWETNVYNNRLQMTQIGLGSSSTDTSLLKIEYDYGTAAQNNGALREQKITAPSLAQPIVQSYAYDDLNRLQSSNETYAGGTQSWKQTFSYDRFGNRRFDAANTNTLGSIAPAIINPLINTSDNRFSGGQGYFYDKVGNLTQDAENQRFVYDREGRQTQFFNQTNSSTTPDATYYYDGEGRRVRKIAGQSETIFVYDATSQLIAEYSNELAVNPRVSYLTADHLGSPRIVTDQGAQVVSRHDYMGFGEEVSAGYANRSQAGGYDTVDGIRQQFTGHERDHESGLDYAQARYYNSRHGRFTSVDPLTASAAIRNPQTFNRYSYVTNSPYKFTDPLGLFGICPGGGQGGGGGMPLGNYSWTPIGARPPVAAPPPPVDPTPAATQPNTPQTPPTPPPPPPLDLSGFVLRVTFVNLSNGNTSQDEVFDGPIPKCVQNVAQGVYMDGFNTAYPGELRAETETKNGSSETKSTTYTDSANQSKGAEAGVTAKSPLTPPEFGGKLNGSKQVGRSISTQQEALPEQERKVATASGLAARNDRAIQAIAGMSFKAFNNKGDSVTVRIGPGLAQRIVGVASQRGVDAASERARAAVGATPKMR